MGLLELLFGKRETSAQKAKKRLSMVLEYERRKLPPNFPDLLKRDLVEIFRKYPQFDVEHIEVELKRSTDKGTLLEQLWISIPFKE